MRSRGRVQPGGKDIMRSDPYFDLLRNERSFHGGAAAGSKVSKTGFAGNGQSLLITLSLICASLFLGGCDATGNDGLASESASGPGAGVFAAKLQFAGGINNGLAGTVVGLHDCHGAQSTAWGGLYIKDFVDRGRTEKVYIQAEA